MPEPLVICDNLVKIYKVADLEVVALQGLDLAIQRHYYHHPRWSKAWNDLISPAISDIKAGKQSAAQAFKAIKGPVDELMKEGAALLR